MKTIYASATIDWVLSIKKLATALLLALIVAGPQSLADDRDRNNWRDRHSNYPYPSEDDPSRYVDPVFGDLPEDLPEANHGAFEGPQGGPQSETPDDAAQNNVVPEGDQRDDGRFNVPTNGPPSPLFGAQPFTQQLLRFEEFGTDRLNLQKRNRPPKWRSLPAPVAPQASPDNAQLDRFLAQDIWPTPTKFANDWNANPWQTEIESWLGSTLR